MKNYFKILIPSTLFLITALFLGVNLGKPFWGEHDWNGARYGNIARNYLRYGLVQTKLGQVENGGVANPSEFTFYTHYQPLLPLLIAGSYKIFGASEFATRVVPLLATAGLVVVIFLIGESLYSKASGLFGALFALATPMIRYYGKNPVHEPLAAFFGSLAFYGAILVKKKNKNGWKILICGLVLTALTNWSFVFLILGLSIFLFDKKRYKKLLKIWVLGVVLGLLHFLHIYFLTGSFFGGDLIGILLFRTSITQTVVSFNILDYILKIRLWASTLFTNSLLAFSVLSLVLTILRKQKEILRVVIATSAFAAYSVFFANASYIHSYFIYYFILPLMILAGHLFYSIRKNFIFIFLSACLLIFAFYERQNYLTVLNQGSGDITAVEVGKITNTLSKDGDVILVSPASYEESRLPILSYYSERNIVPGGNYDWKVLISGMNYEITNGGSE